MREESAVAVATVRIVATAEVAIVATDADLVVVAIVETENN